MRRRALRLGLTASLFAVLLFGAGAGGAFAAAGKFLSIAAAPPANDLFENAEVLDPVNSLRIEGTNVDATKEREPREPDHAGDPGGASVWYLWIAPATGNVRLNTCDSDFDTLLAVYTGKNLDELTEVASDIGSCAPGSEAAFDATFDEAYFIAVDGVATGEVPATGRIVLELTQRPENDNFANGEVVTTGTATGTNEHATKETGEPNHAGNPGGASVWYSWTAAASGTVSIDTCSSTFNTLLGVYTGTGVGGLTQVATNDNACGNRSAVKFSSAAGQTYQIAVDGFGGQEGSVSLSIGPPPANDNLADAQVLSGSTATISATNIGASKQTGEPDHAGDAGGTSVWYRWTAASTALMAVDTCGSNFDTLLVVYRGTTTAFASLDARASSDNDCGIRSRLTFKATSGSTYLLAVDGTGGDVGTVSLRLRPAPTNDDINARDFPSGSVVTLTASNVGASEEPFEPPHGGNRGGASIWYRWQAPSHGRVTIDTCGSDFDTLLGVYRDTSGLSFPEVTDLVEVAGNDNGCGTGSRVTFNATAVDMYWIAVDGRNAGQGPAEGTVQLHIRQPPHNNFADAELIAGNSLSVSGRNQGAGKESGEPDHAGNIGGASVWYRWTAPSNGQYTVDTCPSDFNTLLAVYTGSAVGSLTEVASNNDSCGTQSLVTFSATAGTEYRIAVDGAWTGFGGAVGNLTLRLGPASPAVTSNDAFANARVLSGSPVTAAGNNTGATKEAGEPNHAGVAGGPSIWWRWTAPTSGEYVADACGSQFNSLLAVYTGSAVNSLTPVASNDDGCSGSGGASQLTFNATAGVEYRIVIDGWSNVWQGSTALHIGRTPANDDFASAQLLSGPSVTVSGNNEGASREVSETMHASAGGSASVWYRWTAPSSGRVVIDTCDSPFGLILAIYTGSALTSLTLVGSEKLTCGANGIVGFNATAGTEYRIAVDGTSFGSGSTRGAFQLRIGPGPPNDVFANAVTLSGAAASASGNNIGATKETGEQSFAGNQGGASVWYRWTAPATGSAVIDTCGSDFDTLLGVFTGSVVDGLTLLAQNDYSCGQNESRVNFNAVAGTTYRISVDGFQSGLTGIVSQGNVQLHVDLGPANDDFADAQTLGGKHLDVSASNGAATKQAGEPNHAGNIGGASIWYRWTATQTGRVAIDTCGSGIDTLLGVYTGSVVNGLSTVASNDDSCGTRSKVAFQATDGTTYRIAVDGRNSGAGAVQGNFQLRLRMPPNDDFADAEVISGFPVTALGTNIGATVESGEPLHKNWFTSPNEASVWYRWTAPATGRVAIDTCQSGYPTSLGVYTGSSVNALTRVAGTGTGSSIGACGSQSIVAFEAVASTTYQIAVDGFSISGERPARGLVKLRLRPPPPNDNFAAAELLSGHEAMGFGTNAGATRETDEPFFPHSAGGASVWYRWTAPANGRATIDVCGSDFLTNLAVYTGSALNALTKVTSAARSSGCGALEDQSRVSFLATAGTTYQVLVDGHRNDYNPITPPAREGEIELALKLKPANDDFADAQMLTGGTTTATGSNIKGSKETGEPNHAGNAGGASVWYRWTAPASGRAAIETCGSGFDTVLAVYTGSPVGSLTEVASNDDACGSQSRLSFQATGGTIYRIAVDGRDGAEGAVSISLDADPPETTIDSGPSGFTSNASPSFTFSSETGSTFQCRLDSSLEADFTSCTSPQAYPSLSDGLHTFEARAIDPGGNTDLTPASRSFTVDSLEPDTTIDSGPSGPTNNASPSFTFSSSQSGSTFQCRLDSSQEADFTSCTSPQSYSSLGQGPHTFDVRAIDPAGNVDPSPASRAFNVDTLGPTVTIDSGPSGTVGSHDATFAFSAEAGATFECRLDTETFADCTSPRMYTDLDDGSHTFHVQASDTLGNPGAETTRTWTVDTEGPTVTIDSGPSGTTNDDDPSFAFSAEAGATFQCRLDTETFASCSSPKAYTDLDDGSHTFHVQASDSLGNPGAEATRTFTVDTEGPTTTIDSGPSGTVSVFSATFTYSSEAGATFECRFDFPLSNNPWIACSSPTMFFVSDGPNTFNVRATDTAGNTGVPASRTFIVDTRADVTIDSGPSDPTNETSATFTFSAETGATFQCRLGTGQWTWPIAGDLVSCTSPKTYTGLVDGDYFVDVWATDTLGNTGLATWFWTVDTEAPGVTIDSGPSDPTNDTDATFEFSAEAGATFECRLDAASYESCSSPKTYTDVTETAHTFRVRATDEAGNTGAEDTQTWTVDLTGPGVTINTGPSGTVASANATFQFSAEAGATFECRLDAGDFEDCSSPKAYSALLQGSRTFGVRATDTVGNTGTEATRTWTVDTIAPTTTIDSGPTGTVASADATFTFSANEAGVSFGCRLDFAVSPSPCVSPKPYTSLADGPHTFRVLAMDAAGNVGLEAVQTWTVSLGLVVTIGSGPTGTTNLNDARFEFSAPVGVSYECRLDTPTFTSCTSPQDYLDLLDGSHTFGVRAIDALSTTGSETTRTWTIDTLGPTVTINSAPPVTTSEPDATLTFSSEPGATFQCRLDAGAYASCSSPKTYLDVADGPHTFRVRGTDTLGNAGAEAQVSWTVAREADEPDDASAVVPAGGTVSTDGAGDGASATDPVETSVTTPVAGAVSITETPGAPAETSGYTFLGYQVSITAPTATVGAPLILVFLVDSSLLPAGGPGAVVLHRNGVPIALCTGADATPDPCVQPPVTLAGGDGQFTVRTSLASLWAFGVAKPPAPPPPNPPGPAADVTPPVLQLVATGRQKLAKVLKQGVLASITCSEPCTALAELRLSAKVAKRLKLPVVVGKLQVTLAQAVAQAVKVKLIAKAKRKLARLNSVALALRITATDPAGNASVASKRINLRR